MSIAENGDQEKRTFRRIDLLNIECEWKVNLHTSPVVWLVISLVPVYTAQALPKSRARAKVLLLSYLVDRKRPNNNIIYSATNFVPRDIMLRLHKVKVRQAEHLHSQVLSSELAFGIEVFGVGPAFTFGEQRTCGRVVRHL